MNPIRQYVSFARSRFELKAKHRFGYIVCSIVLVLLPAVVVGQPPITAIAFSPDGSRVVTGSQSGILVFETDRNQVAKIETELESVNDIAFSPDGSKVVFAGGSPSESGKVEVFIWPDLRMEFRKRISDDVVYDVDWSADGKQLAIAGHDTGCYLLDVETKKIQQNWVEHSRPVRGICFLDDADQLVSAGFDQTVRVWQNGEAKARRSLNNHTGAIQAIAVSPVGNQIRTRMIASVGQDKTVRFWQPAIGRMVRFARLSSVPFCVEWDSAGRFVMIGCEDGKVIVVDSQTVKIESVAQVFDGPVYCIDRDPNQNSFVLGGSKSNWRILTLSEGRNSG